MFELIGIEKNYFNFLSEQNHSDLISKTLNANYLGKKSEDYNASPALLQNQESENQSAIRNASEVLSDVQKVNDSASSIRDRLLLLKKIFEQPDISTSWRYYKAFVEKQIHWLKGQVKIQDNSLFDELLTEIEKLITRSEGDSVWRLYNDFIEEKLKWLMGQVDYLA